MSVESPDILSVLYVEKDQDTFDLICSSLESNLTFPSLVDRATNLSEALSRIKDRPYQLLLIDSELDGSVDLAMLEEIKKIKFFLPFVLMVPIHNDMLVRKAYQYGVADLIVKSQFHFQELAGRLRAIYEKHRQKAVSSVSAAVDQGGKAMTGKISQQPIQPFQFSHPGDREIRDALTGVYNHSHLFERMVDEFARAKRHSYPLACLVLDIDHFKSINEKWNHRVGDELLKETAQLLFQNCRLGDFVARYGGEEFAVLMPHTDYQGAMEAGERLRRVFSENRFLVDSEDIHLTISVGIAAFPEDYMEKRAELLTFSVQALYKSKASGRNRLTLYKDIVPIFGKDDLPTLKISEEKVMEFQRRISEIASNARRNYIEAAKAMIMALENKDRFTAGHAATCAKYAMQAAEAIGMSLDEAEIVEHAALLHDIGKVCIPDEILLKPSKLTFAEFETMRQHPYLGYKMLKPLKFLDREAQMVLHHHEWWNGEGYPCRLKGDEIPLGSRIISVVDSYDTMRNAGGRYKKTCSVEDAVKELIGCSGAQFDPKAVESFIKVLVTRGELSADGYDRVRLEEALKACQEQSIFGNDSAAA
ncbi:MAG: diguanylate cyclase [Candidatus Omnitrophica bacterium]|nr:diguanylate cyclase [Candidatus Omnitrophota bacterium]